MGFIEKAEQPAIQKIAEKVKEEVEPTRKYEVVKELPVQQIRETMNKENNEIITFITIEEALSIVLNQEN